MTALLTPYMSCSAKLPVYALLTSVFFGPWAGLAMVGLYVVGMLAMLVLAIRYDSEMYFEGALLMVLFGFVGSVALAKFLLRGETIE